MRPWILLAAVNGLLAVVFAAYAAHGLAGEARLAPLVDRASQMQMVHALALLAIDRLAAGGGRLARLAGCLFLGGIVLFSGSLYVKALAGPVLPGLLTPAGGIAFLLGWAVLALLSLKYKGR